QYTTARSCRSELQLVTSDPFSLHPAVAHRHVHSLPTRRSSDLTSRSSKRTKHRDAEQKRETTPKDARTDSPSPPVTPPAATASRSEEHTSELQSRFDLVCRLLLEKKKKNAARCSMSNDPEMDAT